MLLQNVLCLSSMHLTCDDITWLISDDNIYGAAYNIAKNESNTDIMFYIDGKIDTETTDVPENIKHCVALASTLNCTVIRFSNNINPVGYLNEHTVKENNPSAYNWKVHTEKMMTFAVYDMTDDDIRLMDDICEQSNDILKKSDYGWYIPYRQSANLIGKLINAFVTAKHIPDNIDIICIDNAY